MRVFVMFDLPVLTASDRRAYRIFKKQLIKSGFIMMQESIYVKLCLNATAARVVADNVRSFKPPKGLVQLMIVTEKQFTSIDYIVGEVNDEYISSTDRMVIV